MVFDFIWEHSVLLEFSLFIGDVIYNFHYAWEMTDVNFKVALLSGGVAGTCVDATLFPLDTLKTRLQSSNGFWKSGGFQRIYSGFGPVIIGSAPTAAVFFCTYELTKSTLRDHYGNIHHSFHEMFAAAAGEVAACSVRVPVEVIKQRSQASLLNPAVILQNAIKTEGFRGLYRGFFSTIIREIPFSFIELPLWELLKVKLAEWQGHKVEPWQSGLCGGIAGAASGGITTPLDVAKTRIMLAHTGSPEAGGNIIVAMKAVFKERGFTGLYAGVLPRMMLIGLGGAIFLGIYEKSVKILNTLLLETDKDKWS